MKDVRLLSLPEQDRGGLCLDNIASYCMEMGFL